MSDLSEIELMRFVIAAKKATYIGNGAKSLPSRPDSNDLVFRDGKWEYRDSYFGGTDFLGQEIVWYMQKAVWVMNYHGTIIRPDLFDGARAAATLRAALSLPHSQGRLLDNFDWSSPDGFFSIRSTGTISFLRGRESISAGGIELYALDYQAGKVKN